jgi:hypothetical protein
MHGNVAAQSQLEAVNKAIEELINDPKVPLAEKENELCFFSERLNDIEQERHQLRLQSIELRKISNLALKEVLSPLPTAQLNDTLTVTTGIKYQNDAGITQQLNGDRNDIQTVVEFVPAVDFEASRAKLIDVSRHHQNDIYLLARSNSDSDNYSNDIFRSQEIASRYRNETDKEIKEYCNAQNDRANNLTERLQQAIRRSLVNGEFIFRGNATAVEGYSQELLEANKKHLVSVAQQVFDRYQEAPVRVQTDIAERFMKADNLSVITTEIDPLQLVVRSGGQYTINESHQAITSIKDYIETRGGVDGKTLSENFSRHPFGWSPDTLRYLVAAMFIGGMVKLKASGTELTSSGQKAIDAIKTNISFKMVGVNLRDDRPSPEMCLKAAERLTELTGISVFPLEDEISKAAVRYFNGAQRDFAPLVEKLKAINIPGHERLDTLSQDLADMLGSDASDAPQRLGAEESQVFYSLQWATAIKSAFKKGLDTTLEELKILFSAINLLPETGIPGQLKLDIAEDLKSYTENLKKADFYQYSAKFNTILTALKSTISLAVNNLEVQQSKRITEAQHDIALQPGWGELTVEEKDTQLKRLENLAFTVTKDLTGFQQLLTQEFNIQSQFTSIKQAVEQKAQQKRVQRVAEEKVKYEKEGKTKIERKVTFPKIVTQTIELEALIQELTQLKYDLELNPEIEIHLGIKA